MSYTIDINMLRAYDWVHDFVSPPDSLFFVVAYLDGPRLVFNLARRQEQGLELLCGTPILERFVYVPAPQSFLTKAVTADEALHLVNLVPTLFNVDHPVATTVLKMLLTVKVAEVETTQRSSRALAHMVRNLQRNDKHYQQVLELAAQKLEQQ